ncbi:MAG: DNA cytosine methyltransferase [Alphaproteobacteria bacterium]|nr:DNA cytosine methyltransferase [Alphaproteobacteria bacterium]
MNNFESLTELREIRHFHLFAGLGGGARGFNRGTARVGNMQAVFRCIGGIDVSPAAIKDFGRLAGVPGTVLDLFDADQYAAFHGEAPPPGWRPATPQDIHAAAGGERPHIVFLSAPCKGFSGLLSETLSLTDKYQALNRLTLRGMWLTLEAFQDDPPELIIFENVPRIARRGRALLDRIGALLRHYGYAVAETTHDCGELGGLAQTRKRFLLVARHQAKVPPFLYEPPKRSLRAVGDVLGRMPLPGDIERGGPMHRVPLLQWQTWVRLAFVEAGSDWRSLKRLRVEDGQLTDFRLLPDLDWRNGTLGVQAWEDPAGTVTGNARPGAGAFSVADPRRADGVAAFGQYGIKRWDETSQTVIGKAAVGAGHFGVADPRHDGPSKFSNVYRVIDWNKHASAVTSSRDVAIADPRHQEAMFHNAYKLVSWGGASQAITGQHAPSNGAMCVADPRPNLHREKGDDWAGAGHYGVVSWEGRAGAVSSAAGYDNGRWSVADPRKAHAAEDDTPPRLPSAQDRLVAVIRSQDGTWHRPFTTFELAALQSLVDPEEQLELDGLSDAEWRERIGNAVPPDAAMAIADTMGKTLLLAWSGESFMLSALPIWVRPIGVAMSLDQP